MKLPVFAPGSRPLSKTRPYMKGTDVRHLQQTLKWFGLYKGRVDGIFGPDTERAVKSLQRLYSDRPTGVADQKFFAFLSHLEKGVAISGDFNVYKIVKIKEAVDLAARKNMICVGDGNSIRAFDLSKRKLKWENREVRPLALTAAPESVLVSAGELLVIDAASGKTGARVDQDLFETPAAFQNGIIYASSRNGALYAINQKGEILWRYRTGSSFITPPVISRGFIYFSTPSQVFCLDERGELRWKARLAGFVKEKLLAFEDRVFGVTNEGSLFCLDAKEGKIVWKENFGEEILAPCLLKDAVVTCTLRGKVIAMDLLHGKLKWEQEIGAAPATSPLAVGDAVFIGTESGLHAVESGGKNTKVYLEGKKISRIARARLGLCAIADGFLWELSPLKREPLLV